MKAGELLRKTRHERGLSLGQVAKDLLIQEKYLQALEEGNYEIIPGETFQRAYFKKYAEYLGLGDLFNRLSKSDDYEPDEEDQQANAIFGGSWNTARWARVILKLGSIVVILIVIGLLISRARTPRPMETEENERVTSTQSLGVIPTETAAPSWEIPRNHDTADTSGRLDDLAHEITLRAFGQCWVELTTRDGELYSGTMEPGDILTFNDFIGFHLKAGAPEKLEIEFDGELIDWKPQETQMQLPPTAVIFDSDDNNTDEEQDSTASEETNEEIGN